MIKSYLRRKKETHSDIREIIDDQMEHVVVYRVTNAGKTDPGFNDANSDPAQVYVIKARIDEIDGDQQFVGSLAGQATQKFYVGITVHKDVRQNDEWRIASRVYHVEAIRDGQEKYTEVTLKRLR